MQLGRRKLQILQAVIQDYISSGNPLDPEPLPRSMAWVSALQP